jgi:hypothetical protein
LFSFKTPLLDTKTLFLKEEKDLYYCLGVFIAVKKGVVEYIIRQLRFFIAAQKGVLEYFIRQ